MRVIKLNLPESFGKIKNDEIDENGIKHDYESDYEKLISIFSAQASQIAGGRELHDTGSATSSLGFDSGSETSDLDSEPEIEKDTVYDNTSEGQILKQVRKKVTFSKDKKQSGRPKKYYTEDELKEAIRLSKEKYSKNPSVKEKIKTKNKEEKIDCECGGRYTINNKTNHLKTVVHTKYVDSKKKQVKKPSKEPTKKVAKKPAKKSTKEPAKKQTKKVVKKTVKKQTK